MNSTRQSGLPGVGFWCSSTRPWEESVQLLLSIVAKRKTQCPYGSIQLLHCPWPNNR